MQYYYKQPKYYSKFKCIGGECHESCCDGWMVEWKLEEVKNLILANDPDKLNGLISSTFVKIDGKDKFVIKLCDDGRCPFHNRNSGLCDIQKELGEHALGCVCTDYPRRCFVNNDIFMRWCSASCPVVIDMLIAEKDAVKLELYENSKNSIRCFECDTDAVITQCPAIKYRYDIGDFFVNLFLSDDKKIEDSIILGALAAKHLTETASKNCDSIPGLLDSLKKQFTSPDIARSVSDIKPNYQLKFKLINNMIVEVFDSNSRSIDLSVLHDGNDLIVERYVEGRNKFDKFFENKPYVLRNLIINTFYDLKVPFGHKESTIFDNYAYFVLCAAVIETVAATVGYNNGDVQNEFKKCIARLSRGISHSIEKANKVLDNMKELGINSPAHLALIIK